MSDESVEPKNETAGKSPLSPPPQQSPHEDEEAVPEEDVPNEAEESDEGQVSVSPPPISPKEEPEVTEVLPPRKSKKARKIKSPSSGSSSGSSSGGPSFLNLKAFEVHDEAPPVSPETTEVEAEEEMEDSEGEDAELQKLLLDEAFGATDDEAEEEEEEGWTLHEDTEYMTDPESGNEDHDHLAEIHAWLDQKSMAYLTDKRSEFDSAETPAGGDDSDAESDYASRPSKLNLHRESQFAQFMNIPDTPANDALSQEAKLHCIADRTDPVLAKLESSKQDVEYESTTEPRMRQCPSIESYFKIKRIVDVHFYLHPGKKMISRDCRIDATIYQLKLAISRFVRVPPDHLDLRRKRSLVSDGKTLADLGARADKKMKFVVEINRRLPGKMELQIKGTGGFEIKEDIRRKVFVEVGKENRMKEVEVLIIHPKAPKPNLGGYMDQRKCLVFYHASTEPEVFDDKEWVQSDLHQACQTFNEEHKDCQTLCEKAVQMDRDDYYVSQTKDYIIQAKPYHTFDYWEKKRAKAAVIVQRYWRRWLAIKERKRRMDGLVKRVEWAELIRRGRIDQRMQIMMEELARQQSPNSLLDLELLYRAINSWREGEEAYVKANRWGAERKAALACLTEMEAELLLELERTKIRIIEKGREESMHRAFIKMSQPKRWLGTKSNSFISYDTGGRVKARRLHEIYKSLAAPVPHTPEGTAERVDLLQKVNALVSDKPSKTTNMIENLISRELRYLHAKASPTLLSGVRRRIASTFFCLCKDPKFNDEARRIEKIPYETHKLRKDMIQCKGCRRMQYRDEFTIVKGTTLTSRCHTCMGLYRTAILRVDLNLYRQMLKELRRDEYHAGIVNSVSFLIDAFDVRFLVEQIWHGQSALSGIDNRYLLRLCRWMKNQPWAPWNCVLLTEEEAVAHIQLDDLDSAYRDTFFHKVFVKQATAKTYFEGLSKFAVGLDDRIADTCKTARDLEDKAAALKSKWQTKIKTLNVLSILGSKAVL